MNFVGPGARLLDTDLPRIAYGIGCGEDEIHAFLDVETTGTGYDKLGRPKMLFEPHVFYARLKAGPKRDLAVKQGVAYPKWGEKPYPADSYPRLAIAMAIDSEIALQSASWGIGQTMGYNFVACGYDSAFEMVDAYIKLGEAEQLQGAVNFIKDNHLDDELRSHNWPAFARGYNGSGYAKNKYDSKLEAAYKKWSKIKDTPWTPGESMLEAVKTVPVEPAVKAPDPVIAVPTAPPATLPSTPPAPVASSGWGAKLAGWLMRPWNG